MSYNCAAKSFHTKKLCSRLSSSEVRFYTEIGRFAFLRPPLGDLGPGQSTTIILDRKERSGLDFLLALIELFSLGVTAEAIRAIIGLKSAILLQRGPVDPKLQKTTLNVLSYGINLDRSFYRFVTIHACDGQTERILIAIDRVCIPCSAVKSYERT